MTQTIMFEKVKTVRKHEGKCAHCGKATTRSKTFTQTINPFRSDIRMDMPYGARWRIVWEAVSKEADSWKPDFDHAGCKEKKA